MPFDYKYLNVKDLDKTICYYQQVEDIIILIKQILHKEVKLIPTK